MDINVWVNRKRREILVTDDPGVPVDVCWIKGVDPEPVGDQGHRHFEDYQAAGEYAETKAKELGFTINHDYRFAPWLPFEDDEDDEDFDEDWDDHDVDYFDYGG